MSGVSERQGWGPPPPQRRGLLWFFQRPWVQIVLFILVIAPPAILGSHIVTIVVVFGGLVVVRVIDARGRKPKPGLSPALKSAEDPLPAVREFVQGMGSGPYLGLTAGGGWRQARSERAVLLLGPPRSGKTSGVIVPAVIAHPGPVVCTSTKPDVLAQTGRARERSGRLWVFDPTGASPPDRRQLRWSPVRVSAQWDGALLMARAMTAGARVGHGTTNEGHWARRAQALLAPLLHAAAVDGRDMEEVVGWVMAHEIDTAGVILEQESASRLAFGSLLGIYSTEPRERASIFSAAADAMDAYTAEAALQAAREPNFDPAAFVNSNDTIYIHAPAEEQAAAAPLVCGLLAEIRRATYLAARQGTLTGRVLFALDEAANIAPLEELPQVASEGGSQGLLLLAAFQDLSQARARWGQSADGFLTLFGTKLILPGIADPRTLETISTALGEYDRQIVSHTRTRTTGSILATNSSGTGGQRGTTVSTQRTRVLSPGEIANIPAGRALHLDGLAWELLTLTPAHATQPWQAMTGPPVTPR